MTPKKRKFVSFMISACMVLTPLAQNTAIAGDVKTTDIQLVPGQQEYDSQLRQEVKKTEYYQEMEDSTCYRDVPDGTEQKCETRYNYKTECSDEYQCHDETECDQEYKCHDEYRCHDEQKCGYEQVCYPEQICKDDRECHVETKCRPVQECTYERECRDIKKCHDERVCEYVNGERVCHIENKCDYEEVCRDVPKCTTRQECTDERICVDRPVCHTETRCSNEYRCHTEQECRNETECGYETVCRDVPKCGYENVCREIPIPYQHCETVPKYKKEAYACKKPVTKSKEVLVKVETINIKVFVDPALDSLKPGDKLTFKKTVNGVDIATTTSDIAYYHQSELSQPATTGIEESRVLTVKLNGLKKADLLATLKLKDLKADKKRLTFTRVSPADVQNMKPFLSLNIVRTKDGKSATVIDRDLEAKDYTVDPATQVITVDFKKLGISKETKKKGEYTVKVTTGFLLNSPNVWVQQPELKIQAETNYKR